MTAKQNTTISSTSRTMMHTPYWGKVDIETTKSMKRRETHQRQKTLRLTNRPAVAEKTEEEHQPADADEDVDALVD
jgi:hypothetical protein